jgi:delta14-sterol reductase
MTTDDTQNTPARRRRTLDKLVAASLRDIHTSSTLEVVTMSQSKDSSSETIKKEFHYEFGGPIGTLATTLFLPIVVLLLAHWTDVGSVDFTFLDGFTKERFWDAVLGNPVLCPSCQTVTILLKCASGLLLWFGWCVLCERCLPCELVEGAPVNGDKAHKLKYRINGHLTFWVTLVATQVGWPTWHIESGTLQFGPMPLNELLYANYAPLALMATLLCTGLSAYLYLVSFQGDKILADGGNSGYATYDFFIGRELNPRWGTFDWKEFCELRPGLIGWMLLNMACLQEQYHQLGYVTGSMMLINLFQGIYVWDAVYQERAILTTMDITTDGFGFMLVFGDMAWVPFTYSVPARYLVQHDPHLSVSALALIVILHICGYMIFRGANSQKDAFRRDPNGDAVKHLKYIETKRGTKLLTSGWWGMARKINYTGDYLIGLTWCLVCGFESIVPYYYSIYFMILLVHRSIRDDDLCSEKYGADWLEYKKQVPYRFIPGLV